MNTLDRNTLKDFTDKDYAHAYMAEILNAHLATQIKVLREQNQWSQSVLGDKAGGMKQERISLLENVNYGSWSINMLRKLAKAFDLVLWVSFENFTTGLRKIESMSREGLQRTPRMVELPMYTEVATPKLSLVPWGREQQAYDEIQTSIPLLSVVRGGAALSAAQQPQQKQVSKLGENAIFQAGIR